MITQFYHCCSANHGWEWCLATQALPSPYPSLLGFLLVCSGMGVWSYREISLTSHPPTFQTWEDLMLSKCFHTRCTSKKKVPTKCQTVTFLGLCSVRQVSHAGHPRALAPALTPAGLTLPAAKQGTAFAWRSQLSYTAVVTLYIRAKSGQVLLQ